MKQPISICSLFVLSSALFCLQAYSPLFSQLEHLTHFYGLDSCPFLESQIKPTNTFKFLVIDKLTSIKFYWNTATFICIQMVPHYNSRTQELLQRPQDLQELKHGLSSHVSHLLESEGPCPLPLYLQPIVGVAL